MATPVRNKVATKQNLPMRIAIICGAVYLCVTALSIAIAHIMLIVQPQSGWGERIIAPVAKGLEFLDAHWKAVLLILIAPFVAPVARDLISRLRKAPWGLEFDPVPLVPEEVRERPHQEQSGATQ